MHTEHTHHTRAHIRAAPRGLHVRTCLPARTHVHIVRTLSRCGARAWAPLWVAHPWPCCVQALSKSWLSDRAAHQLTAVGFPPSKTLGPEARFPCGEPVALTGALSQFTAWTLCRGPRPSPVKGPWGHLLGGEDRRGRGFHHSALRWSGPACRLSRVLSPGAPPAAADRFPGPAPRQRGQGGVDTGS